MAHYAMPIRDICVDKCVEFATQFPENTVAFAHDSAAAWYKDTYPEADQWPCGGSIDNWWKDSEKYEYPYHRVHPRNNTQMRSADLIEGKEPTSEEMTELRSENDHLRAQIQEEKDEHINAVIHHLGRLEIKQVRSLREELCS